MTKQRIDAVRRACASRRLQALVVAHLPQIRYLTGFTGSNALYCITKNASWLLTDGRYAEQVKDEVRGARAVIVKGRLFDACAQLIRLPRNARIGYDPASVSVAGFSQWKEALPGRRWIALDGIVEAGMAVKDELEVAVLREAIAISEKVFREILRILRPGVRESDVAAEITYRHRLLGAEADAFEPIVASGVRGALPHGRASDKKIRSGELVTIDFGCRVRGYHSDITRTVAVGRPSYRLRAMYDAVLDAQTVAIDAVRAGVRGSDVDAAARRALRSHSLLRYFRHSLGHGLGLEVHEWPRLSPLSKDDLQTGNVVTVEPGVYVPGVGGVRIEDDVLVRPNGGLVLTALPKKLICL